MVEGGTKKTKKQSFKPDESMTMLVLKVVSISCDAELCISRSGVQILGEAFLQCNNSNLESLVRLGVLNRVCASHRDFNIHIERACMHTLHNA